MAVTQQEGAPAPSSNSDAQTSAACPVCGQVVGHYDDCPVGLGVFEPTATHLPVWDVLFAAHQIKDVLEFGCGLFSTRSFVARGCNVTSIEMQHREWFDKIKAALPTVDLRLALGPQEWRHEPLASCYDLIFVDGHGDSRPDCLMWAKDRSDIIVAHDTEHPYYDWDRADMSGFNKRLFDALSPTTTVWTKRK